MCAALGWRTSDGDVVHPDSLTVAQATKLQTLDSHVAIATRHADDAVHVGVLDAMQHGGGGATPTFCVCSVDKVVEASCAKLL